MSQTRQENHESWPASGSDAPGPLTVEATRTLGTSYDRLSAALLPPLQLGIRVWLGQIFLGAGLSRLGDWPSQIYLFTEIHPAPFLPAGLAAPVTTAAELGLSICFILGLFGRVSALGLLIMTMVIQWLVGQTPQGIEHGIARDAQLYWMALFAIFALIGPGSWSLDRWRAGRGPRQ